MSAEVLGREAELEELAKLLDPLRHGTSVRVGLIGDAGVGKTALLDLAAWRVGVSTVRIAGFEHGMGQPMRGLLELVRALPTTAWSSITPTDRQVARRRWWKRRDGQSAGVDGRPGDAAQCGGLGRANAAGDRGP